MTGFLIFLVVTSNSIWLIHHLEVNKKKETKFLLNLVAKLLGDLEKGETKVQLKNRQQELGFSKCLHEINEMTRVKHLGGDYRKLPDEDDEDYLAIINKELR